MAEGDTRNADGSPPPSPQTEAETLVSFVEGHAFSPGEDGNPAIEVEPGQVLPIQGGALCDWLTRQFEAATGTLPSAQATAEAVQLLLARAAATFATTSPAPFETMSDIAVDSEEQGAGRERDATQTDRLLALTDDIELFHTPDEKAFARYEHAGHREIRPVRSDAFKKQLMLRYYRATESAPAPAALDGVRGVLEARALFDGPCQDVFVRVAGHDGTVYVDLVNDAREVVAITPSGWRVITDPPVRFLRMAGMQALPTPVTGGSLAMLKPYVNVSNEDSWHMLVAFLVGSLRPDGPFVLLLVQGEQGSAKSTTSKIVRSLLDPSTAPLRRLPKNERDLAISANNARILAFDNLSGLSDALSDALCTLATGGGLSTRKLYSDDEEAIFDACRPIILNGIDDIATRPDLADRSVVIKLERIENEERIDEEEFERFFKLDQPAILGALFDVVSGALRELPTVRLAKAPRMADFARWVTAAERSLGWPTGTFERAYERNRATSLEIAFDDDPVAVQVHKLLGERPRMVTSATKLYDELKVATPSSTQRMPKWPKAANALAKHLQNRAIVPLSLVGITITASRGGNGERLLTIERATPRGAVSAVGSARWQKKTFKDRQLEADGTRTTPPMEPSAPLPPSPIAPSPTAANLAGTPSCQGATPPNLRDTIQILAGADGSDDSDSSSASQLEDEVDEIIGEEP